MKTRLSFSPFPIQFGSYTCTYPNDDYCYTWRLEEDEGASECLQQPILLLKNIMELDRKFKGIFFCIVNQISFHKRR